jgi:hypothetical protein
MFEIDRHQGRDHLSVGAAALLSFERGEGLHVEAVARRIRVFEEAEPETLECGGCHGR